MCRGECCVNPSTKAPGTAATPGGQHNFSIFRGHTCSLLRTGQEPDCGGQAKEPTHKESEEIPGQRAGCHTAEADTRL